MHVPAIGSQTPAVEHMAVVGSQNSEQQSLALLHVVPTVAQVFAWTQSLAPLICCSHRPVQHSADATQGEFTPLQLSCVPNAQRFAVHVPEQHWVSAVHGSL